MVALMSQVAALDGHERVLEIGTGSGYQAAVLSRLGEEVYSIEAVPTLHDRARVILAAMDINNVFLRCSDGSEGWPEAAPFDLVMVTAAMPGIVRPLLDQLGAGGRLVAPIGEDELQTLVRIRRVKGVWADRARVILAAMDINKRILAMHADSLK
jgi:protein-L-isoaspartate(D-aspartate) O-methyltransferase